MPNAITPIKPATFNGELIYNMENYVVSDTFCNYVNSMDLRYRATVINKRTGFENVKYVINDTTGDELFIDININLVGSLPRWLQQQLNRLAKGVNSAGMELLLRDNWCSNYEYSCRWLNAGNFTDNSTILNGASLRLEAWDRSAI